MGDTRNANKILGKWAFGRQRGWGKKKQIFSVAWFRYLNRCDLCTEVFGFPSNPQKHEFGVNTHMLYCWLTALARCAFGFWGSSLIHHPLLMM
jgi:hypothetical protein